MAKQRFAAEALSEYITSIDYEDIPQKIIDKTKQALLDSIGCMLGGSQTAAARISSKVVRELGGKPESTLLGLGGGKVPCLGAVFVNSTMANALDFDDTLPWAGHPGATIVPPALAIGEKIGADGKSTLAAILLAYEVTSRIGKALRPSPEGLKKVWGYGTWQTFGATVAAGKLLGLSREAFSNAFGIAGCNAPVPSLYKSALGPAGNTMVKNNYGTASQVGTLSAFLAAEGFEGPTDILDGDTGFWRMAGSDRCQFQVLTENLHRDFLIEQLAFKPYPSVRWNHSAIDGVLQIMKEHHLQFGEMDKISIRSFRLATHHPFDIVEPETPIEAVFSTPFDVAVAAYGVPPGPEWYTPRHLKHPQIIHLAKKVELIEDREANQLYPEKQLAKVSIQSRGGLWKARIEYPRGEAQNPLRQEDLEAKFRGLLRPTLGEKQIGKIIEGVHHFEDLQDIRKWTRLLSLKRP